MTSGDRTISTIIRVRVLAIVAVCVLAAAVWVQATRQYRAADAALAKGRATQQLLTAMLDQQSGLRGYTLTREEAFLEPYRRGTVDFEEALATLRRLTDGEVDSRIDAQVAVVRQWHDLAEQELAELQADPTARTSNGELAARKRIFDQFRELNFELHAEIDQQIDFQLRSAAIQGVALVLGVSLFFAVIGYFAIEREVKRIRRRRDREHRDRESQTEFAEGMQVMRNELEAYDLVKRHLERSISRSRVVVLNRNNSDNRIHAVTPISDSPEMEDKLRDASPETCLAVRLSRTFTRTERNAPLLSCDLCASASHVCCVPSLVSGDVIGAVLVQCERRLDAEDTARAVATVAQSAPVLGNLRSLAIAETRAATDALTGLPNARACRDTLKRMVAHAGRTVSPLSALMLDLDHFKQINDRFGHGAGDDVLAAVGAVLQTTLRASDFAGRYGGEEFLMLLPDTDVHGGREVANKVRQAISRIHVAHVERTVTVSVGIASYPRDARNGDELLRQADRALYMAKSAGRDRVEEAVSSDGEPPGEPADVLTMADTALEAGNVQD